jgi:hypothetical protein
LLIIGPSTSVKRKYVKKNISQKNPAKVKKSEATGMVKTRSQSIYLKKNIFYLKPT